jgi:metalloendopeptidase OMA1, mitochondrial
MSKACYNPEEAIEMWERMSRLSKNAPNPYLSTHPSHEARIVKLREWMPEARKQYELSDCGQKVFGY